QGRRWSTHPCWRCKSTPNVRPALAWVLSDGRRRTPPAAPARSRRCFGRSRPGNRRALRRVLADEDEPVASYLRGGSMKFSKVVFTAAGVWGLLILTPLYFLHDAVAQARGGPVSYPEYFGFLAITVAWQFAFLVIGTNPGRFRLMMLPAIAEKA